MPDDTPNRVSPAAQVLEGIDYETLLDAAPEVSAELAARLDFEKVVALSLKQPSRGCNHLEGLLALDGIKLSSITIQKILNERGLGTKFERWLALEKKHLQEGIELSSEQIAYIEKLNPAFKERHVESSKPGELLSQDTLYVGQLKGVGKVYLHTVVDTFGSFAFGFLHTSKQPEAAAALLHNEVLPFYAEHGLPVENLLTDNGREFCGTDAHPYEIYLALNGIEHRTTKVRSPRTNGFVERMNRTLRHQEPDFPITRFLTRRAT